MYGTYKIPFEIERTGLKIGLTKENKRLLYKRLYQEKVTEQLILSDSGEIHIQPVEPLNLPKQITTHLLLEFSRTVMIEPDSNPVIYLIFPVEIGVFLEKKQKPDILDIFSLNEHKYTLYGDPNQGIICKYWLTDVFNEIPSTDPLRNGVIKLNIMNKSSDWIRVNKAVFKAHGMKIYFNQDTVSMKANMKIHDEDVAETDFMNSPLIKGMKKSIELFTPKRLSVLSSKSVMLEGI